MNILVPDKEVGDVHTERRICGHIETCEVCFGVNLYYKGLYFFTNEIDEDTAEEFRRDLYKMALERKFQTREGLSKDLTIYLESPGGSVMDGMAMYNTVNSTKKQCGWKVTMHVQGMAASMATVLLQSGDIRLMGPGTQLLLHNIRSSLWGEKLEDMKNAVKAQDTSFDTICGIYAARNTAGYNDPEWWKKRIRHEEWYLTAEEALEFGLIDGIE